MPRHVTMYVLVVDAIAIAATSATAFLLPVTRVELTRAAVLFACALVYIHLSRSIERVRKLTSGAGPFVDGLTLWDFAALLVLPPQLAAALIVLTHTAAWLLIWRHRRPLYRWLFSDATVLIGTQLGAVLLIVGPGAYPGVPTTVVGLAMVITAAGVRWFANYTLVLGAILVSAPEVRVSKLLSEFGDQILEAGALGLGLAAAGLTMFDPLLLVGIVIGLVALHRGVLLAQFRKASRTDAKTGLHTAAWWHQIAEHALARAADGGSSVAVLMMDLDHFKEINDAHGHIAGDEVLRAVAQAIASEVRGYDSVGRWGGEEFAVVLPDLTARDVLAIAERVRRRVRSMAVTVTTDAGAVQVDKLTVSIGGALFPWPGVTTLDDLVLAADGALYTAKAAGRDRVTIGSPEPVHPAAAAEPPTDIPQQERHSGAA
ncbi:MAG TPA: GGDEF domain-containing protein [Pseudonocardiaceae bacterium]|nr:GGDEF domain-containing protein [Pseudonocardiaceae bacterium]